MALLNADKLTNLPFKLDCATCPRDKKCDEWGLAESAYKYEGKPLFNTEWKRCPTSYLNMPQINYALTVLQYAKVNPITNWPFGYARWLTDYVTAIHQVIEERRLEDITNG